MVWFGLMSILGGTRELPAGRAHRRGVSEPPAATAANVGDTSQPRAAAPRVGGGLSVYISARPQATHPLRSGPFRAEEGCDGRTGTPEKKPRASPFLLPPGSQILGPRAPQSSPELLTAPHLPSPVRPPLSMAACASRPAGTQRRRQSHSQSSRCAE